jgi:glycosyltransferase involved in cell wall biosynthesis
MKIAMIGLRGLGDGMGGIEKAVREISVRMVSEGHNVTCYCKSNYSNEAQFQGVALRNIPTVKGKYLETMLYSIRAIIEASRKDYDVIHIHALASSCLAWIPKFIYSKKVIITVHGLDWQRAKWGFCARQLLKFGEWASAKFTDMTICVSRSLSLYYKMKYSREEICYIPNGCDKSEDKYDAWDEFESQKYFLYLGRLVREKGVHRLIEAYQAAKTDKKLIIAGPDSDPKYSKELHEMAKSNPNIIFTGAVYDQEKIKLLSNAYLFILPSEIEGLPIALLEAGSYGVCSAVSHIPTCDEVIDNKILSSAFSFDPYDSTEIKTVLELADQCPQVVKSLASKLQNHILNEYNWDDISSDTLAAYDRLVNV